jgi:transposase InsO family protein
VAVASVGRSGRARGSGTTSVPSVHRLRGRMRGNPFDNAKAESFMKTLKAEEVNGKAFVDLNDARHRIDSFIADVYNKERLHSALEYHSPLEFETAFAQNKAR